MNDLQYVCCSAFQLHHLSEGVLLASLRPRDRGALLGPSDLLQMHAPQVATAWWFISCWADFLLLPVEGQSVLFDCVILSGSPTRQPTGRRWRPTTARGTSAAQATTRAETNVSVSNYGNLLTLHSPTFLLLRQTVGKLKVKQWERRRKVLARIVLYTITSINTVSTLIHRPSPAFTPAFC